MNVIFHVCACEQSVWAGLSKTAWWCSTSTTSARTKQVGEKRKNPTHAMYSLIFQSIVLSGIDAGGLFKDFLTELSSRVFDPQYGLFQLSPQQQLYPHPSAAALLDCPPAQQQQQMQDTFAFIGRVLGKGERRLACVTSAALIARASP